VVSRLLFDCPDYRGSHHLPDVERTPDKAYMSGEADIDSAVYDKISFSTSKVMLGMRYSF